MPTTIIKSTNSDNQAIVDDTGHLLVTMAGGGTQPVSGTVDTDENPLHAFKTTQYPMDSTVQTAATLLNRVSLSIRVTATDPATFLLVGDNAGTVVAQGYPLYDGDTLQLDLAATVSIYLYGPPGVTAFIMELAK